MQEGGCPFTHFDREHLTGFLHVEGVLDSQDEIVYLSANKQPSLACRCFYEAKVNIGNVLSSLMFINCSN